MLIHRWSATALDFRSAPWNSMSKRVKSFFGSEAMAVAVSYIHLTLPTIYAVLVSDVSASIKQKYEYHKDDHTYEKRKNTLI